MDEDLFWQLIAQLDWAKLGDDEAVCAPVVVALAARPEAAIHGFEEILAQKLFALDTEAHARQTGENAYVGPEEYFSVDAFLYARCCVVANGQEFYERVRRDPTQMPADVDFEALLGIAGAAFEARTGGELEFTPSVSYETFANAAGWPR
ncbi:MAG: DUF4240 domain-containing protein [Planctomycetes bacterium]|nr:DUF4240 domain-containing protein [Planctomycetota bacterium]